MSRIFRPGSCYIWLVNSNSPMNEPPAQFSPMVLNVFELTQSYVPTSLPHYTYMYRIGEQYKNLDLDSFGIHAHYHGRCIHSVDYVTIIIHTLHPMSDGLGFFSLSQSTCWKNIQFFVLCQSELFLKKNF